MNQALYKRRFARRLAILLVGFMLFFPYGPALVIADDGQEGVSQELIDKANNLQNILDQISQNPAGSGYGPDNSDEVDAGGNDGPPQESNLGPDNSDEGSNSDGNDEPEANDGPPQASDLGPQNSPSVGGTGSSGGSPSSGGTSGTGSSSTRDDLRDLVDRLPKSADEAAQYREEHFDDRSLTTDDTSGSGNTETTATTTPTTTADNDVNSDDSINSNTASTTDETTVGNDQYLEQENITQGQAVSGGNVLESDKDVLEGSIKTGQAGITSDGEVKGNTSNVETGGGSSSSGWVQHFYGGAGAGNNNSGDDNILNAEGQEVKSLTVINKNKAFISNVKELLALSGGNRISALHRFAEGGIFTGGAYAKSSLLNLINTNTVNSAFLPITFDIFDNYTGNINILELLFEAFGQNLSGFGAVTANASNNNTGEDSILNANASASEEIDVLNEQEGYIYNDLDLAAVSGQNQLLAGYKAKEFEINTGVADVTNNLISFLNTNLFESKIGVVVINVFSDWMGNLIMPGAGQLANSVPNPSGASATTSSSMSNSDDSINSAIAIATSDLDIVSEKVGEVDTQIKINANTGLNEAVFDKDAGVEIESGNVKTQSNMLTLANRDIIGTAFSHGFFSVLGDWTGNLVGTPSDARVQGSDRSFIVASEGSALAGGPAATASASNTSDGADDSILSAKAEVTRSVKLNNKSEGRVVNRLNITADTGTNEASAYKGSEGKIKTGDAKVSNNIATFLNNNFSFSKGVVVALNVFGDWQGNIAYDELTDVGVDVMLKSDAGTLAPGSSVNYQVKVGNFGTEPTAGGQVSFSFDSSKLELVNAGGGQTGGETISWNYGAFESAESSTYNVVLKIKNLSAGQHSVSVGAAISGGDDNSNNDSDVESFTLSVVGSGNQSGNDNGQVEVATGGNDNSPGTGNNNPGNNNSGNSGSGGPGTGGFTPGYLLIKKTNAGPGPYAPGDIVNYIITVSNPGDTVVQDVVVYDVLKNGTIDADGSWPLDDVLSGESVEIEYEIGLLEEAASGPYTNTAYASGFDSANATIRSGYVSTTIQVENNNSAAGNSDSGVGGSGAPSFGVIGGFNEGATSTIKITREPAGAGAAGPAVAESNEGEVVKPIILSPEEEAAIEAELASQMKQTSRVSRQFGVVARAADLPAGLALATGNGEVAGSSTTRLAVYPDFLNFSGLERNIDAADSGSSIFSSWLFWLLLLLLLLAGYVSYKEKQRQLHKNARQF